MRRALTLLPRPLEPYPITRLSLQALHFTTHGYDARFRRYVECAQLGIRR